MVTLLKDSYYITYGLLTINFMRIEEGGIWENEEFEILDDYEIKPHDKQCRHVVDNRLRAVVVAANEGGYNSTGVCAQCIVEALNDNNIDLG